MGVLQAVLDNPILVKHARSRLRLGQAVPWAVITLVLSACIAWAGNSYGWIGNAPAVMTLVGLQILALCFAGSSQLNISLGGVRESGLLDYHRISPLSPRMLALGFFLGAPVREYLLAAVTLPFAIFSASQVDPADPWRGLSWLTQIEIMVLVTSWNVHAFTMLSCMTRKKPRGTVGGTVATILLMLFLSYLGSIGFYFGSRWLLDERRLMNFFGFMIPWLAWVLIYEIPLLVILSLAVSRKMRAERMHSFTKPQALAVMTVLIVLMVGGLWNVARLLPHVPPFEPTPADLIMMASIYVLSLVAIILAITITPDAGAYIKGLRRAARQGSRRLSPWSDAGSNRLAILALCVLVVVGATTVIHIVGRQPFPEFSSGSWANNPNYIDTSTLTDESWVASRKSMLSRPIVVGVLTVAYAGLCLQYFSLRTRSSGLTLMTFFLFIVWLVPMLAAASLGLAGSSQTRNMAVFALSPLPGIALASGIGNLPSADTIQLAALAPPITFAFIFNYLVIIAQRNIDRRLHAEEKERRLAIAAGPGKAIATGSDDI